jgi:pyruvate dehydrogenase E2 component (dihydrolipoamide acetyltransferase)
MAIEILMPALSPTMTTGNLVKWYKKIGDKVRSGDLLIEIETDKSTMDYECVESGILAKIFIPDGTNNVKVNDIICVFAKEGEDLKLYENYAPKGSINSSSNSSNSQNSNQSNATLKEDHLSQSKINQIENLNKNDEKIIEKYPEDERIKVSPSAKRIAVENNIKIDAVRGTGVDGRIVKIDIINSINSHNSTKNPDKQKQTRENNESIPISTMRKVIADRLTLSKQTVPHFYLSYSCQVDELMTLRKKINEMNPELKITINDLIVKAIAGAMSKIPEMNRSWGNDSITQYKNVDIAIAVDIPDGLITPIVENADQLSLANLSKKIKDLAGRARENKLKPNEYQGGSITISNLGMFGVNNFLPIINTPQASIIAIGGVQTKIILSDNDQIKQIQIIEITIAADHRIIDGALAAKFVLEIKKYIENPIQFLIF